MNKAIPVERLINEYMEKREYNNATLLCALMLSFGSDKGGPMHNYSTLYSKIFTQIRNEKIHLFELGIARDESELANPGEAQKETMGSSLHAWAHFFPNGFIYGGDIAKNKLFNGDRIKTFYVDQGNEKSIQEMFASEKLKDTSFDIIIEDGLHEFEYNLTFLINSIHKLKSGGIFIIEDLNEISRLKFNKILNSLKTNLLLKYIKILQIPLDINKTNNALLIIQK
jgi:hypothetical protein